MKKRGGAQLFAQSKSKKTRQSDDLDKVSSDDESSGKYPNEESDSESEVETADDKRIRMARDFLRQLEAEENDQEDDGGDGVEADEEDRVGKRLHKEHLEATGQLHMKVAHKLRGRSLEVRHMPRGHQLALTCVALSSDDTKAFTGSKDNSIIQWDIETGAKTTILDRHGKILAASAANKASKPTSNSASSAPPRARDGHVLAVATSSDGRFLASGGRDKMVRVWDARTGQLVQSFGGHRDAVTSLHFRHGSQMLFSGSADRGVKHWNLQEMGYVETLFGHQSDVSDLHSIWEQSALTTAADRTLRLWKVEDDTQLIFRCGPQLGQMDCCRMLTPTDFVSGSQSGTLCLWSSFKKKPVAVEEHAHGPGPGVVADPGATSISALASMPRSDLIATGATDGYVRFWQANTASAAGEGGGKPGFDLVAEVELEGCVNGITFAASGKFAAVVTGREPKLGRWWTAPKGGGARNLLHVIELPPDLMQDS